jgi:hypothetical protein
VGPTGIFIITTLREYKLDQNKVFDLLKDTLAMTLTNTNIDLFFDIGEIDLSISREQVQYNKKTIESIAKKMQLVANDLKKKIDDELAATKNGVEYRIALSNLWNLEIQDILNKACVGNKYGIMHLPRDFQHYTVDWNPDKDNVAVVYSDLSKSLRPTGNFNCWRTYAISKSNRYDYKTRISIYQISIQIKNVDNVIIIVRDGVHDAAARAKYYAKQNGINPFFIVAESNIFGPEFTCIKASDLDKIPKVKKVRIGDNYDDCYYLTPGSKQFTRDSESFFKNLDKDRTVSINIKDARSIGADGNDEVHTDIVRFLIKEGYSVVGHKTANMMFQTPKAAITKLIVDYKKHPEVIAAAEISTISSLAKATSSSVLGVLVKNNVRTPNIDKILAPIQSAIDLVKSKKVDLSKYHDRVSSKVVSLKSALAVMGESYKEIGEFDYSSIEDICKKTYPMLQFVAMVYGNWSENPVIKISVEQYVNLIEKEFSNV